MKKLTGCLFTVKFSEGLGNLYVCENVRGSHVCSSWVSLIYYIRSSLLKTALLEIESRGEHSLSFLDLAVVGLLPNSYSLLCYCHPRQVCQYEGLVNSWEVIWKLHHNASFDLCVVWRVVDTSTLNALSAAVSSFLLSPLENSRRDVQLLGLLFIIPV